MNDTIYRQDAIEALEREKTYSTVYRDGYTQTDYFKQYNMGLTDGIKALNKLLSAQPEYYDYSDIDDIWEYYAEEQEINLTDGAKQIKDAMWVGYRKGKQDTQSELIRCKDCENWERMNKKQGACEVWSDIEDGMTRYTDELGFCYMAERRKRCG